MMAPQTQPNARAARGDKGKQPRKHLLIAGTTPEEAVRARDVTTKLLERLGLRIKPEKCQLTPVQRLEHLGLTIDTIDTRVSCEASQPVAVPQRD